MLPKNKPLNQMTDAELNAYFAEIDEMPMRRTGGLVAFMGTPAEFRARNHPLRYELPKPAKKKRRPTAIERLMQLDEMEVRMRAEDRKLRELGII